MKKHMRRSMGLLAVPLTLLLATSQLSASETPEFPAEEFWFDAQGTLVDVVTPFEFQSIELRVRKRGETEVWTETFGPGVSLSVDLAHVVQSGLTDDRYTYELRFITGQKAGESEQVESVSGQQPASFSTAGTFSVEGGQITDLTVPGYQPPGSAKGNTIQSDSNLDASSGGAMPMDVVDAGELAIGGWGVFGSNDTNDIVDGKLRVLASPTGIASVSVQSQATNDDDYAWHFGVQDGGDFGLQRQRTTSGAKTTVLGIEEDAAANSLMITQNGSIGMGTSTPSQKLHVTTTNANILALERTGSFPNTWYVSSSESWFSIGESTSSGNNHPFSLRTGAPGNSLVVAGSGDVGVSTSAPDAALHVDRSNNTAQIRVEDSGTSSPQVMFSLIKAGYPQFQLQNTAQSNFNWTFRLAGNSGSTERFEITKIGTGGAEFELYADGSANFRGDVTANGVLLTSTREAKTDFRDIDERDVLEKLASLEISEWRYKHEDEDVSHIGPIAEQFHEVFGLSDGKRLNMIDTNGITFAAIQALNAENQELKDRLAALEQRLLED